MIGAYVALGLPAAALGVAWDSMRADFDRPLSNLGLLLVTYTVGYLAATLTHPWIEAGVGTGWVLAGASAVAAVGALGFALGPAWAVVLVAAGIIGVSGGYVDAALNAHVALFHSSRVMNLMHGGFGIGATLGPLVMTALIGAEISWRWGYAGLAVVQFALAVGFAVTRAQWPSPLRLGAAEPSLMVTGVASLAIPSEVEPPPSEHVSRSHRRAARLGPLVFLVYGAVEVAIGSWAFVLLTGRGVASTTAGVLVTAYWGALAGGRLVLGAIGNRVGPAVVVTASMVASLAGCVGLWLLPSGGAALSLVVVGLGLSGVFPALMALTPVRVGPGRATAVIGRQLAAGVIGGAVGSAVIGLVAQHFGSDAIGPALAVTCLSLVVSDVLLTAASTSAPRLH